MRFNAKWEYNQIRNKLQNDVKWCFFFVIFKRVFLVKNKSFFNQFNNFLYSNHKQCQIHEILIRWMFFFDQNVDLDSDFNDFTITQISSIVISSVFSLLYSEKLDELFTIFDSIEYVENFQNDEKNNSNIHIENDHVEINFWNNDRSVAVQSIRYYKNNDDHDQIVKNIHNMNNNSREDFHNDDDMNTVNVDSIQFENSKISETETETKTKTKDFHEKKWIRFQRT